MAIKNMTPKMAAVDRQIDKINKRLVRLARQGMYASSAYQEITSELITATSKIFQQAEAGGLLTPKSTSIRYRSVKGPDGQTVQVMQVPRAKWMLQTADVADFAPADEKGTGRPEYDAARALLEEWGKEVTPEAIQEVIDTEWERNEMLNYVWDYLYKLKHFKEVQDFFNRITGKETSDEEIARNNAEATRLYAKYAKHAKGEGREERGLTAKMHADIYGAKNDKFDRGMSGQAMDELKRAAARGDKYAAQDAARKYLRAVGARNNYGLLVYGEPTQREVDELVQQYMDAKDFAKGILKI